MEYICKKCKRKFLKNSSKINHEKTCRGDQLTVKERRLKSKRYSLEEKREHIRQGLIKAAKEGRITGKASTPEKEELRKKRISITGKLNPNCGGLRKGSGRGKKGYYKGIWCDSSWELAWVIYNLEHNIEFKRNWNKFEYQFNNELHFYIPDFILSNNNYIEIKGRRKIEDLTEKEIIKINTFKKNNNLNILFEKEIKPYIDYVINKYGYDYIQLYDKK
jgi:hypothetical protein